MSLCIVVEGLSDKIKVAPLLAEPAIILCTNGTISEEGLLELLAPYETHDIVTLFDADKNGEKLRKLMQRCFSEAQQLIIPYEYIEVAETPAVIVKELLQQAQIAVK